MLLDKGYEVSWLSRSRGERDDIQVFLWNPEEGVLDESALDGVDVIVHLAGLNIGDKRWTPERKRRIVDSRVKSGELLLQAVRSGRFHPQAYISASGIGYYGASSSEIIWEEDAAAAEDFLGQTCRKWEAVGPGFEALDIRTVMVRTGVVLSDQGGALKKLSLPVRLGAGASLGSGKQFMPWIHIDDLCGIFLHVMEDQDLKGAYNAVAPEHVSNKEFTRSLARVLKRPMFLPGIPAPLLRLVLGERSLLLLEGSRVSSQKIRSAGYSFLFPELKPALKNILSR
jgi:uncharacterized protein (TIGR01777 family)